MRCKQSGHIVKSVNAAGYCRACEKQFRYARRADKPFDLVSFCASILAGAKKQPTKSEELRLF